MQTRISYEIHCRCLKALYCIFVYTKSPPNAKVWFPLTQMLAYVSGGGGILHYLNHVVQSHLCNFRVTQFFPKKQNVRNTGNRCTSKKENVLSYVKKVTDEPFWDQNILEIFVECVLFWISILNNRP